jgi:hypothetical protein
MNRGYWWIVIIAISACAAFVDSISELKSESDYAASWDTYGIGRTNANFWHHSDKVHAAFRKADPVGVGRLDYSRLENR